VAYNSINDSIEVSLSGTASFPGQLSVVNGTNQSFVGLITTGTTSVGGAALYDPSVRETFVTGYFPGTVSIVSLGAPPPTYAVTFTESGLPSGKPWNVTFNAVTNGSLGQSIGFLEPSGTYGYTVGAVPGFTANRTAGTVPVTTGPQTVLIGFSASSSSEFSITFQETGLPFSTPWSVTLGGVAQGSSTLDDVFSEPNGTYPYAVGTVTGFGANPSSGTVPVAGSAQTVAIVFSSLSQLFTVTLVADPSTLVLGHSTTLRTTTSGGTAPFSYSYSNLPTGCSSTNTTSLSCTPTGVGTFHVSVTATDHSGATATANVTVTVNSANGTPSSTTASFPSWIWIVIGLVSILILWLLFAAYRRRRKEKPKNEVPAGSSTAPPVQAPPPPPPPPPPAPM
jgi:hypothetical protein